MSRAARPPPDLPGIHRGEQSNVFERLRSRVSDSESTDGTDCNSEATISPRDRSRSSDIKPVHGGESKTISKRRGTRRDIPFLVNDIAPRNRARRHPATLIETPTKGLVIISTDLSSSLSVCVCVRGLRLRTRWARALVSV